MTRARRISGIALFAAAIGLSGCNYFRPAEPQTGDIGPIVLTDYSTPDNTLSTLALAIDDKSATTGQSAYIGGFADPSSDGQDFTATFDAATVARFNPAPDLNWSIQHEQLFYHNLSQLAPGFKFVFGWGPYPAGGNDVTDLSAGTATLFRTYSLQATPDDGTTLRYEALGIAELHLIRVGSKWKIVKWIDTEDQHADFDNNQRSFGYLRLAGP